MPRDAGVASCDLLRRCRRSAVHQDTQSGRSTTEVPDEVDWQENPGAESGAKPVVIHRKQEVTGTGQKASRGHTLEQADRNRTKDKLRHKSGVMHGEVWSGKPGRQQEHKETGTRTQDHIKG